MLCGIVLDKNDLLVTVCYSLDMLIAEIRPYCLQVSVSKTSPFRTDPSIKTFADTSTNTFADAISNFASLTLPPSFSTAQLFEFKICEFWDSNSTSHTNMRILDMSYDEDEESEYVDEEELQFKTPVAGFFPHMEKHFALVNAIRS